MVDRFAGCGDSLGEVLVRTRTGMSSEAAWQARPDHTAKLTAKCEAGERIHENEDVWIRVLTFLPLVHLRIACATCHAHRGLALSARQHVKHVKLSLVPGELRRGQQHGIPSAGARIFIEEADGHAAAVRVPVLNSLLEHWAHLPTISASYPSLSILSIDLSPCATSEPLSRLIDVVSWFSRPAIPLKPVGWPNAACQGALPWRLIEAPNVETLQITAAPVVLAHLAAARAHGDAPGVFEESVFRSREEHDETFVRLEPLLLMCFVACAPRLRHLDLSGVGPGAMSTLLAMDLPQLRLLRLGNLDTDTNFGWIYERGPTLALVGRAFPTLTALDAGYGRFAEGVGFAELDELLKHARGMAHLDLSMVMTYVDFGRGLASLSHRAPNLRSLAVHGLYLPPDALLLFAAGCPLLERLHLVSMQQADTAGFLAFLRACASLKHLDLSESSLPEPELLAWLKERDAARTPLQSLTMHDCTMIGAGPPSGVTTHPNLDAQRRAAFRAQALVISPSTVVRTDVTAATTGLERPARLRLFAALGLVA